MSGWSIDFGRRIVRRLHDGLTGAVDDRDPVFREYQAWLAAGGTPTVETTPLEPVPEAVPAHHLRRALRQAGLRERVEALIASLPIEHPIRDDWEYAPTIRRDAAWIEAVRQALSLTHDQVDDVFRVAATQTT